MSFIFSNKVCFLRNSFTIYINSENSKLKRYFQSLWPPVLHKIVVLHILAFVTSAFIHLSNYPTIFPHQSISSTIWSLSLNLLSSRKIWNSLDFYDLLTLHRGAVLYILTFLVSLFKYLWNYPTIFHTNLFLIEYEHLH